MKIEHRQNILNKMIEIVPDSVDEFSWDAVTGLFGFLKELEDCPQDPIHHAEGNVGIHTRMVIKELIRGQATRRLIRLTSSSCSGQLSFTTAANRPQASLQTVASQAMDTRVSAVPSPENIFDWPKFRLI